MIKKCERCNVDIPEDFVNAICAKCYPEVVKQSEAEKKISEEQQEEERVKMGRPRPEEVLKKGEEDHRPLGETPNPPYQTNPQLDDINMVSRNIAQFLKSGKLLWHPTRSMYNVITNTFRDMAMNHPQYPKFVWKPMVADIGCGIGAGSNILSQEADFVWGIDKNPQSVAFAREAFRRLKNHIYYTPELWFDVVDVTDEPNEISMKFDVTVSIEVFEHLVDPTDLIKFHKRIVRPDGYCWFSVPNRLNKSLSNTKPKNKFHVFEPTSIEFHAILSKHFNKIQLLTSAGVLIDTIETNHTPILALCSQPK